MAVLRPYPFGALVRRALRELDEHRSLFDLPVGRGFLGEPGVDLSVRVHGHAASSPFGPAAGPQSQLAQNIALAWLGGARVIELKTVQLNDHLALPRPCIDMQTIGYNVEWSQELTLAASLAEYVKASMLLEILVASGRLALAPGFDRTVFDMSVGYDLAGIRSEGVQAFIRGLGDATALVDRLRHEIPGEYRAFRDLPFTTRISDTLTLSTFHGCPPGEIERMVDHLMRGNGLHCVVKLNPTLLGPDDTRRLLHDVLGYHELTVPAAAFARDPTWSEMREVVGRLGVTAASLGRGFGVKLTNTLIVENHRDVFPASEREMYLSGAPLHVLAMALVSRFRDEFGRRFPVSFSAGIDRHNFADAVALGLVPVTACSDLLKPRGYARSRGYFLALLDRMRACGAASIEEFTTRAGIEASQYLERLARDARYTRAATSAAPRKIGRRLQLFDCITCDKCIPVCPNDANFAFVIPPMHVPVQKATQAAAGWIVRHAGTIEIAEPHQIGNFADFCNDCGNCDVFCPEDGGPYILKPRFFGSLDAWRADAPRDGFFVEGAVASGVVYGRLDGRAYELITRGDEVTFRGDGFDVSFERGHPVETLRGTASVEVDLTYARIMERLLAAVLDDRRANYVNCLDTTVRAASPPEPRAQARTTTTPGSSRTAPVTLQETHVDDHRSDA